ncbi:MAG: response regulator [Candidatus Dormibacteria bacterium]
MMDHETLVEILLVEDSDDDAEMTTDALNMYHLGNHIVRLRDGQEALDYMFLKGRYADRHSGVPKVILLDIKMPRVDGLEVLRQLRGNAATASVPVVLLTSSAEERDLHMAYQLHANSYIVKPVNFEQFVEAIREIGMYWLVLNLPQGTAPAPVALGGAER